MFSHILLQWFRENGRALPWRETRDPYAVWLSEVILQQTRIEQGRDYWLRFVQRWPTVEALAAATDQNQWPEIVQKSEEQLKALLKPEQLKNFDQAINDKLITIRFSKEPWANVLKWFAAELGLQLVMNAPPPGTFNYNDKNSYTPKEALDILNGRLQFQGYTLLRTGNMLYVHNFKDGPIPMQFLPKVTVEELPEQSRFSYVALTLPLGQRSLAKVLAAIKPFQGPYNSTQALTGNALLIVDSVNALREIVPVALGILNPPLPPALSLPVWQTYVLTNVSPTFVDNEVKKFLPSARPLYNPAASQISYLAIPSVHAVIDGLIKRLEEGGDPSKDLSVAVYPLDNITNMSEENLRLVAQRFNIPLEYLLGSGTMLEIGKEIAEGLQTLCPGATIVFNEMTKQVMVVAMPEDQEKIKKAVELLQTPMSQPQKETFAVYDMGNDKTMSTREVNVLQRMVTGAQINYDKTKNSNFSLSNVRWGLKTKRHPMPYDPANFSFSYSHSHRNTSGETTVYDREDQWRGAFNYSYSPVYKTWEPFKRLKGKSKWLNFPKSLGFNYLPQSIAFNSEMTRHYRELQERDLDNLESQRLPLVFSEQFLWNRDFSLRWDFTKNLHFNFQSATRAEIEEPYTPINKDEKTKI